MSDAFNFLLGAIWALSVWALVLGVYALVRGLWGLLKSRRKR